MSEPIHETKFDQLPVSVYQTNEALGQAAAAEATEVIGRAIRERGIANVILATGNSQLTFLTALRQEKSIDWSKVNVFHMDEYIGIDPNHPASFPNFMRKHLLAYVKPLTFYPVSGQRKDIETVCSEY
ncbi:MAG TPA: 6-phosphogluconolactonase, partial [Anaerolineae bacterium]